MWRVASANGKGCISPAVALTHNETDFDFLESGRAA
jgi:hypothetical protein